MNPFGRRNGDMAACVAKADRLVGVPHPPALRAACIGTSRSNILPLPVYSDIPFPKILNQPAGQSPNFSTGLPWRVDRRWGSWVVSFSKDSVGFKRGNTLAKGRAEGEAKSLTRLLERRFGPLPAAVRSRIDVADLNQLDAWIDRVLDAMFAAANKADSPA